MRAAVRVLLIVILAIAPIAALTADPAAAVAGQAAGQATPAGDASAGHQAVTPVSNDTTMPWWGWSAMLFGLTILIGVVAVIGGVGGGVLFVPIVSAFFPFHFDFIRGTGLLVTLCGALAAAPRLLRHGMSDLKLALPMALFGSIGSIAGAWIGLSLPTEVLQSMLGFAILGIVILMLVVPRSESLIARSPDRLAVFLGIGGRFHDPGGFGETQWTIHRTPIALVVFVFIGMVAGMFGLGAGWANVPALHLLLGAPIKVAVATSGLIVAINNSAAAWIYLNDGAVLPLITVPSVVGMMIGTGIGARLLPVIKTGSVRWIVISLLAIAGIRSVMAGFGWW
jgi:hypothetical protein